MFSEKKGTTYSLNKYEHVNKLNDLIVFIYNTITLDMKGNDLRIEVCSIDDNPSFLFDLWNIVPNFSNIIDFV